MAAFATCAAAQTPSPAHDPATYSGTLLDATGRALPGVPLTLVSPATGQKREIRTDDEGRFSMEGIPAGAYELHMAKPGFKQIAAQVRLEPAQRLRQDIVAQIGGLRQMYKVSPEADAADGTEVAAGPRRIVARTAAPDDPCIASKEAGCITPPTRLVEARPIYPPAHAAKGESGAVDVSARLGTDGRLKDLRPNDGADPAFAAAAIEAMRFWEYSPIRVNGIAQECEMLVTFRFETAGK